MFNFLHIFFSTSFFLPLGTSLYLPKGNKSQSLGNLLTTETVKKKSSENLRGLSLLNWDKPQGLYVWIFSNKHIKVFGKLM